MKNINLIKKIILEFFNIVCSKNIHYPINIRIICKNLEISLNEKVIKMFMRKLIKILQFSSIRQTEIYSIIKIYLFEKWIIPCFFKKCESLYFANIDNDDNPKSLYLIKVYTNIQFLI